MFKGIPVLRYKGTPPCFSTIFTKVNNLFARPDPHLEGDKTVNG